MGMCGSRCLSSANHRRPLRKCQARKPYVECGGLVTLRASKGSRLLRWASRENFHRHHPRVKLKVKRVRFWRAVRYSPRVFRKSGQTNRATGTTGHDCARVQPPGPPTLTSHSFSRVLTPWIMSCMAILAYFYGAKLVLGQHQIAGTSRRQIWLR